MKLRTAIIFTFAALLLAACQFSLAEDVTPPPGYVPPTPAPTLGPLFPVSAPDVNNGAAIYAEKCLPCHGQTGLGDGPQSADLPARVAPLGLPENGTKGVPSAWYTVVTQGNLERFMPPFSSLSDQERWDVITYALTLHTTPDQIEKGKNLFESKCADCAKKFSDLKMMSALSELDLVNIIKNGQGDIPAFGKDLTDDEALAVAAYVRTLTFATLQPTPTIAPATETPIAAEAGTPSAEGTPVDGTQAQVTAEATAVAVDGVGNVSGSIENKTGAALPSDLKITLRGFEHGSDASTGPQEVFSADGTVNADGGYVFENMDIPENRIYRTELELGGITYQSEFTVVKSGDTKLEIPAIAVYGTTEDFSVLKVDALQIYFDYANESNVQILAVYSITNPTDKAVVIKVDATQEIPFLKMPNGATAMGYEATQDSAPFIPLTDGFAMPPTDKPYGLIAFSSAEKGKDISIDQAALLPISQVMILVPQGVTAKSDALTDNGPHDFQGGKFTLYSSTSIEAGGHLKFTLSGAPASTAVNPDVTQNQTLLIGVGALGIALIAAGAWLYWRDRKHTDESDDEEGEDEDDEFEDSESIMDAIIALDDLHREGKLSDEAYQKRRAELKNTLKRKS